MRAGVNSTVSWADYWNRRTTIYVNARHRRVHYERVSQDLLKCLPGPGARVVDYGCGDSLYAHLLAGACDHLFLCDSAPAVRESLAARYSGCPNVSVITPEQFERLDAGTIDAIVANSVIQYLSATQFAQLLSVSREKLSPEGRLVLGDVVPRRVGPLRDAVALLKLAGTNGFLLSAAVGLVKSCFSDYPRVRREAGFLQFEEAELLRELEQAGFAAKRYRPNIGHSAARMTFLAVVRADCDAARLRPAPEPTGPASLLCPPGGSDAATAGLEGSAGP